MEVGWREGTPDLSTACIKTGFLQHGMGLRDEKYSLPLPGRYHSPRLGLESEEALYSWLHPTRVEFSSLNRKK